MHQFVADQRQRERDGLPSLAARGRAGKPSIVTASTRQAVFYRTRGSCARRWSPGKPTASAWTGASSPRCPPQARHPPGPVPVPRRRRPRTGRRGQPAKLAEIYDPSDRGLRDAWETIIVTGRRCSEVLKLRLDCLGPLRRAADALARPDQGRQLRPGPPHPRTAPPAAGGPPAQDPGPLPGRHNRPPTAEERAGWRCSRRTSATATAGSRCPTAGSTTGFKRWIDDLDIGRWVPHQARHSLATSLLRAGASLTHIRRYLGQVSERMAEHYVHLAQSDLEDVLSSVWVAGPGTASPGEVLSGAAAPLTREQAQALAIDLSRRSTPAEGGFCTFQPVVDGGACPWNLDCHNCDKFVLSGADLLYWRRKREQWRLLAEGAPDDATADYLHRYFEPTARAIDGLEKALAGLGLLDQALALDLRKPQDYFHRIWSVAFRAADLADARRRRARRRRRGGGLRMSTAAAPPRTAAALAARRRTTEAALQRAHDAIARLRREKTQVSVAAVSRRADVSRTFLYDNPEARAAIAAAMAEAGEHRSRTLADQDDEREATWRERALNAEDALKAAHTEILAQRTRIGELLGQIRDMEAEWTEEAIQRITTENATLKQRVRQTDRRQPHPRRAAQGRPLQPALPDRRVADLEAQLAPPG